MAFEETNKHYNYCVFCDNYISSLCMSCHTKTNGMPSKYCEMGSVPKKSNFKVIKAMSIDQLAEWLDKYGAFEESPWMIWWDTIYCNNCESIMCHYEDSRREFPCAWCELEHKCKFFPEMGEVPDNKEIIKMWLESEVDGENLNGQD